VGLIDRRWRADIGEVGLTKICYCPLGVRYDLPVRNM